MVSFETITGPAHFASYFVNGDASGLTDEEKKRADAWLDRNQCQVVDVARDESGEALEPRFTWQFQLYDPLADFAGGDVLDYLCEVAP